MTRARPTPALLLALLLFLGAAAAPAQAQTEDRNRVPNELWEEYPLGAPTEESGSAPSSQQRQPTQASSRAEPTGSDDGSSQTTTIAFVALGLLTLLAVMAVARRGGGRRRRSARRAEAARATAAPVLAPEQASSSQPGTPVSVPAAARPARPAVPTAVQSLGPAGVTATAEPEPPRAIAPPAPESKPESKPEPKPEPVRQLPPQAPPVYALGYTTFSGREGATAPETQRIGRRLEEACQTRGLALKKLVGDVESTSAAELKRPGLVHAQDLLSAGEATCLVVESLDQLSRSAGNLGTLIGWLTDHGARLVVVDIDLDTSTQDGRLAADALVTVGALERRRLEERTRKGLEAARDGRRASGRPAVADKPSLKRRIAEMRASGMTLQAIADALNAGGIPTLRGGAEWRPSSVQAAAGYKRPSRKPKPDSPHSQHSDAGS